MMNFTYFQPEKKCIIDKGEIVNLSSDISNNVRFNKDRTKRILVMSPTKKLLNDAFMASRLQAQLLSLAWSVLVVSRYNSYVSNIFPCCKETKCHFTLLCPTHTCLIDHRLVGPIRSVTVLFSLCIL